MRPRSIQGETAIVGIGESGFYRWGDSPDPEFKLCLDSVLAAVRDAGLEVRDIDGFTSYGDDRNEAIRIAAALGLPELRHASKVWGGGGGGGCGAVGHAAAAVACGQAECVVVVRALAQGQHRRYGQTVPVVEPSGPWAHLMPYGVLAAPQFFAMKVMRYLHDHGIERDAIRAISMASYHHAQCNPRAVMRGRPLTEEKYDTSRWIVEPFRLFDCCQESDGAVALILTTAERAADLRQPPAFVSAALQGSDRRQGLQVLHNEPEYGSANSSLLARRLYEAAGISASDIDVVQSYEHFTGAVLMALVEHGFFAADEANEFLTVENLTAPNGRLPLNTSGGNLAECYVHGLQLVTEAVRQIRGESTCQVDDVEHALVTSGPMVAPTSSLLLAKDAAA